MEEASIAYTFFAPACTAKKERIPDPAPTSMTILVVKIRVNKRKRKEDTIKCILCLENQLYYLTWPVGMLMCGCNLASYSVAETDIHRTVKR
jgi:hypothetical protein